MKSPHVFSKLYPSLLMSAVAVLLVLAASSSAEALSMSFNDGTDTMTFEDNYDGLDMDTETTGSISFGGSFGGWIYLASGRSKPAIGSAALPELDLWLDGWTASSTLTVSISETDFGSGGSLAPWVTGFSTLVENGLDGLDNGVTLRLTSYFDPSNQLFGTGIPLAQMGTFSGTVFGDTEIYSGILPNDPFSLTLVAQITSTEPSMAEFHAAIAPIDAPVAPVPEPATIMLVGSGLIGFGGWSILRQRKDKTGV